MQQETDEQQSRAGKRRVRRVIAIGIVGLIAPLIGIQLVSHELRGPYWAGTVVGLAMGACWIGWAVVVAKWMDDHQRRFDLAEQQRADRAWQYRQDLIEAGIDPATGKLTAEAAARAIMRRHAKAGSPPPPPSPDA